VRVYDCLGTPAPGVQVSIDPSARDSRTSLYYVGAPGITDPADAGDASTSSSGLAVFINVLAPDAGYLLVPITATPLGLGMPASRESPFVQAGVTTEVEMPPTP
jgi:hypothetical protein